MSAFGLLVAARIHTAGGIVMTRRDWWTGICLVLVVIVLGFVVQTAILREEIRAVHTPTLRPLASAQEF